MMKRYTAALLNNWIFDIKTNTKSILILRNPEPGSATVTRTLSDFHFFFTERTQYIVDYN